MILLIDNYDSFVYNLARYAGKLGRPRQVVRNDAITVDEIAALNPQAIILSPGPCTPAESGVCRDVIRNLYKTIPILGVCLGHQCIGEAFGGRTVRADRPMHGKTSLIDHDGNGLFMGLPHPLEGARYQSLIAELPENTELRITARVQNENTIMAMRHHLYPVFGIQFHPESVLTEYGLDILRNFMILADEWNEDRAEAA
jgi:para-aminobenzoate synthetase component 2